MPFGLIFMVGSRLAEYLPLLLRPNEVVNAFDSCCSTGRVLCSYDMQVYMSRAQYVTRGSMENVALALFVEELLYRHRGGIWRSYYTLSIKDSESCETYFLIIRFWI